MTETPAVVKAHKAIKHMRATGYTPWTCDPQVLRLVLIEAACPIVCARRTEEPDAWHHGCIARADAAMAALGVPK